MYDCVSLERVNSSPTRDVLPSANLCKQFWNQVRTNKMSGLIWIQSIWHSDTIPEKMFEKLTIPLKTENP